MKDVSAIFDRAAFIAHLGVALVSYGEGTCETRLAVRPEHRQQDGFIHAGVQATMADHTAGGAAATLTGPDQTVLSVEFKINLLRPARGDVLVCRARVLRGGRTLSVVESEVLTPDAGGEKLVAKATVTLAVVPTPTRA